MKQRELIVKADVDHFVAWLEREANFDWPLVTNRYRVAITKDLPGEHAVVEIGVISIGYEEGKQGLKVEVYPLTPVTAAEQRVHVIVYCWGTDTYPYYDEMIRRAGVVWEKPELWEQGLPAWIREAQQAESNKEASTSKGMNDDRDQEICRLKFEEHKTVKEIVAEISRQAAEKGWTPIHEERIEWIYRQDDRHAKRGNRN